MKAVLGERDNKISKNLCGTLTVVDLVECVRKGSRNFFRNIPHNLPRTARKTCQPPPRRNDIVNFDQKMAKKISGGLRPPDPPVTK